MFYKQTFSERVGWPQSGRASPADKCTCILLFLLQAYTGAMGAAQEFPPHLGVRGGNVGSPGHSP